MTGLEIRRFPEANRRGGPGSRARREMVAARTALSKYGTRWSSTLGLRGYRISPLSTSQSKSLFRLTSPLRRGLTLHLYRGQGVRATQKSLASLTLWLASLQRQGDIGVPVPVAAPDGSYVVRVPVPGEDQSLRCLLLRWVPGRPRREEITASDLRLVGTYLGRLHDHAERFSPPGWFVRPEWSWERVFGPRAALWRQGGAFYSTGQMGVLREAASRATQHLEVVGKSPDTFGVVHGDPHAGNLVFCEDYLRRRTVRAIDFDRSGWGHYSYDLAVVLRSLNRYGKTSEEMRAALLEGYGRVRSPGPDRHLAACALQLAVERANWALSWGDGLAGRKGEKRADLLRRTLACAVRYLEDDPRADFG